MDVRAAFTDEEWKQVKDLPSFAALMVMSAGGSGPVQMVKESAAAAKVIAGSQANPDPLVAAVVADLAQRDDTDKAKPPEGTKSREAFSALVLTQAGAVASLVSAKAPDSATPYSEWVLGLAHKVAEAAKEGSVMGIGGVRVTPEEEAALAALATALGG